ncbi:hypothetical protein WN943_025756 [Citrus x changshan-huyou]
MANNSATLLSPQSDGSHCWTFFSTAAYGTGNKGNMAREDKWDKTLQTNYMSKAQEQMRAIVSLFAFGK